MNYWFWDPLFFTNLEQGRQSRCNWSKREHVQLSYYDNSSEAMYVPPETPADWSIPTKIYVPVHMPGHWALIIVDFVRRTFLYCDSFFPLESGLTDGVHKKVERIQRYISEDTACSGIAAYDWSGWVVKLLPDLPQQKNTQLIHNDCGVFVLMWIRRDAAGLALTGNYMADTSYIRLKMLSEILAGCLMD